MASKRREARKTLIPERKNKQMGKPPICDESIGLKKGPWTSEEDQKLKTYIETHGHRGWGALPNNAGLNRCGKSCRLRWINYLRPNLKRGNFTKEEEQTILHWQSILGNKWSSIASYLPGRTDNQIKNFWNTRIRKKLRRLGFDPTMPLSCLSDQLINHQQYYNNNHAMKMQMEVTNQLLFYGQHLFDPIVAAPSLSVSDMSPYCQSLGTPLDNLCSSASFSVTENLEPQPLVQQHQNQSLWLSQLCVEQQVHDVQPSNYVSTTSSVDRFPCLHDNLEAFSY